MVKRKRPCQMTFWVTENEREIIVKKANQAGISTSEFLRTCALSKHLKVSNQELVEQMKDYSMHFGRLCSNVNQIARRMNQEGKLNILTMDLFRMCRELDDMKMRMKMILESKAA